MAQVTVITGGSGGLGQALARALASRGHLLVLAGRRKEALEGVAASLNTETLVLPTDVRRRAQVEHLRDAALARFGKVDVWINAAGRGIRRSVLELGERELDELVAVNARSALFAMQAIVPHFQARGEGHLINVSSLLSRVPWEVGRAGYDAAHAALNALTADLRLELRQSHPGVRVTLVIAGRIATGFAERAIGAGSAAEPEGGPPPESPEEVAEVIAQAIEEPAAEVYTRPALARLAQRYLSEVELFEPEGAAEPLRSRLPRPGSRG